MSKELSTEDNAKKSRVIGRPFQVGNPGGGRPPGSKNVQTLFREAMKKLAENEGLTVEQYERDLAKVGVEKAKSGDFKFYQDTMDRLHGRAVSRNENLNINKDMDKLPEDERKRLDDLIK